MEDNILLGIKEDELINLSIEITNYADKLLDVFQRIDFAYEEINDDLAGSVSVVLNGKYQEIKCKYPIIKDNVISYSTELISLINKLKQGEQLLVNQINIYTDDINGQVGQIKSKGGA